MHKIGILSDTHNLLRKPVTDLLQTCDLILHAGDISTPQILKQLESIAPVYAVRGNTDRECPENLPRTLSVELYGIQIFMIHNKKQIREDLRQKDLIIYGHSHKYEEQQVNGQTWLNPGSCGKRRFSLPLTMAALTIPKTGSFTIEKICLESGKSTSERIPAVTDTKELVRCVMRETDKGKSVEMIARHLKISQDLAEQICRLYLTHPGVSADGILRKMGL